MNPMQKSSATQGVRKPMSAAGLVGAAARAGMAAVLALVAVGAVHAKAEVGSAAPDFQVPGAAGGMVKLSDLKGRYVVLEWTNEGCPFVQKHYQGNMQGLQKQFVGKDVEWLTVFSSAPGKQGHVDAAGAKKFQTDYDAKPTQLLLDESGELGRLYQAKTTPHMYVIDPDGKLIYMGGIDDVPSADAADIPEATNYVQLALGEALAGQPVSTPVSKPYGCSIKY